MSSAATLTDGQTFQFNAEWQKVFSNAETAAAWHRKQFTPSEAAQWLAAGVQAGHVYLAVLERDAGTTPDEYAKHLERLEVEEYLQEQQGGWGNE